MTTTTTRPLTLGELLFGEDDAAVGLQEALRDTGALGAVAAVLSKLSNGLREASCNEVANVAAGVLELDVIEVLVAGWGKYEVLTDAARRTLEAPGTEEIVDLGVHRITSTHRPRIDVFVDGVKREGVGLEIDLSIELHAVRAVVASGRLMALRSGRADLDAELNCQGVRVASANRQIDLSLTVGLGTGIALIQPPELLHLPEAGP